MKKLKEGDFVVTAEITPPVSTDPAEFLQRAMPLRGLATAINVTDGAGAKVHLSSLVAAHFLLQGCDLWLNTPRKPLEASGTSGMKAAINGVPNLSVADGWWAEGATGTNGWVIEGGAPPDDHDAVDAADASALYRLLEEEIVPAFYDRGADNIPRRWIAFVKESIRTVAPRFCARRMLKEYVERMYRPALHLRI